MKKFGLVNLRRLSKGYFKQNYTPKSVLQNYTPKLYSKTVLPKLYSKTILQNCTPKLYSKTILQNCTLYLKYLIAHSCCFSQWGNIGFLDFLHSLRICKIIFHFEHITLCSPWLFICTISSNNLLSFWRFSMAERIHLRLSTFISCGPSLNPKNTIFSRYFRFTWLILLFSMEHRTVNRKFDVRTIWPSLRQKCFEAKMF